jgi:hypothetical protein
VVDIRLKVDGNRAVLDYGSIALSSEQVEERVKQILPLLAKLLAADVAEMSLTETELHKRFRGIAAQNMIVEATIHSTILHAELLSEIASGRESIADHGFPEFADE